MPLPLITVLMEVGRPLKHRETEWSRNCSTRNLSGVSPTRLPFLQLVYCVGISRTWHLSNVSTRRRRMIEANV